MSWIVILLYALLLFISYWIVQLVYIKCISPLRHIPGPLLGKLSGMYVKRYIKIGKYHQFLEDVYNQYGDVVHFAPNRVMINTKKGADLIYSSYKLKKAPFYRAFDYGAENIFSTSDREVHTERRKIINSAISSNNLKKLEPLMIEYGFLPLKDKLNELSTKEGHCDIYKLIHQVLFNINGQLIISEDFNLLNNEHLPILKWLKEAQIYGIMQFEFPIVKYFGNNYGKPSYDSFIDFCEQKIIERKQILKNDKDVKFNDILQYFLDYEHNQFNIKDLVAEVITGFIAGTDTTANTITWTMKLLLENKQVLKRVVDEIDGFYKTGKEVNYENSRKHCIYLEACINEAMRLYPIGAGFLPRIVPEKGMIIEDYFIPEDTEVGVGTYAYHRSKKVWKCADQFQPERFLDKSKLPLFLPFLQGPRSCVGREFAWLAMFHFFITLFRNFEVDFYDKNVPVTPHFFLVLKPLESSFKISIKPRHV